MFEADPRVGGKCLTVEVDGKFYDLGAIQISSAYHLVTSLAAATKTPFRRYGVIPKSETGFLNSSSSSSGSSSSGNSSSPTLSDLASAELLSGIAALARTTKRYFRAISSPGMLQAGSEPSLAGATFSEFAARNKFGATLTQGCALFFLFLPSFLRASPSPPPPPRRFLSSYYYSFPLLT